LRFLYLVIFTNGNDMAAVQLRSTILSHPGKKRPENEDYVDSFEPDQPDELKSSGCLYLVADGVGGEAQGQVASRYAVQKAMYEYYLHPEIEPAERLEFAFRKAAYDLFQYAAENMHARMATTMVAAVIRDGKLIVANVGDSRAYLISAGKVRQITKDHNRVGEMVRDGLMSAEEGLHSRAKNQLTRSVGGEPDVHVDIFEHIPLQPGDMVLLCTDGLTRYALAADIARLTQGTSLESIAQELVEFANQSGGADNVSVVLVRALDPSEARPQPRTVGRLLSLMELPAENTPIPTPEDPEQGETQGQGSRLSGIFLYIALGATGLGLMMVGILVGSILGSQWVASSAAAPADMEPAATRPPAIAVCIASMGDNKDIPLSELFKKFGVASPPNAYAVYRQSNNLLQACALSIVKESKVCTRVEISDPQKILREDLVELPGVEENLCASNPAGGYGYWLVRP
jgi:serine/threonine protein phosphatase PrpC